MNTYLIYGRVLMWLGVIGSIVVSLFGFPFFVPWGLVYIFTSRIPRYGLGGPNNTAIMMLGDILVFVISIAIFTILIGYVFKKLSEKNRLTSSALTLSMVAHAGPILALLIVIFSCYNRCDAFGVGILLSFAALIYFVLGTVSWILLWINKRKRKNN